MPASPAKTQNLGLPRFAPDDSTRTWEHLNGISDGVDKHLGAWKTYTPVWSQSNGTILKVGSGSLTGRYTQVGKTVMASIRLVRASNSWVGSGNWIFSLPPVTPMAWNMVGGSLSAIRGGKFYGGAVFPVSSKAVGAIVGDLGRLSTTIPTRGHKSGDWYSLQVVYEAA